MIILLLIILVSLIVSDFKSRSIYIWQLLLFAIAQVIFCLLTFGKAVFIQNILLNGSTLLFLSSCVGVYVMFRFRGKNKVIGWGDILFAFALTPYFSLSAFLLFIIVSLLLTLGGWALFYMRGYRSKDIPLVSTIGICYSFLLIFNIIFTR